MTWTSYWNEPTISLSSKAFAVTNGSSRTTYVVLITEGLAVNLSTSVGYVSGTQITNIRDYPKASDLRPMDKRTSYLSAFFSIASTAFIFWIHRDRVPVERFIADYKHPLECRHNNFQCVPDVITGISREASESRGAKTSITASCRKLNYELLEPL